MAGTFGIDAIRQHKADTKRAIDGDAPTATRAKVRSKSQTNSSIKKGEDALRAMSSTDIEAIRARLQREKADKIAGNTSNN